MHNGNSGCCVGGLVNKGLLFCYLKGLLCVYFWICKSIKASLIASNEVLTTAERGMREGEKGNGLLLPTHSCRECYWELRGLPAGQEKQEAHSGWAGAASWETGKYSLRKSPWDCRMVFILIKKLCATWLPYISCRATQLIPFIPLNFCQWL